MTAYRRARLGQYVPGSPLVFLKRVKCLGEMVDAGEPVPEAVPEAVRRRLWISGYAMYDTGEAINQPKAPAKSDDPKGAPPKPGPTGEPFPGEGRFKVTQAKGGMYVITDTTGELDEETVRGKQAVVDKLAELNELVEEAGDDDGGGNGVADSGSGDGDAAGDGGDDDPGTGGDGGGTDEDDRPETQ